MNHSDDAQVVAVLHDFTAAWKRLDGDGIARCFGDEAHVTVIGTDPGEYTVGMPAYRAGWAAGGYPSAATEFDWESRPAVHIRGDAAWSHGLVAYDLTLQSGEVSRGRMWITTVLYRASRETEGGWKLMHLHASHA